MIFVPSSQYLAQTFAFESPVGKATQEFYAYNRKDCKDRLLIIAKQIFQTEGMTKESWQLIHDAKGIFEQLKRLDEEEVNTLGAIAELELMLARAQSKVEG